MSNVVSCGETRSLISLFLPFPYVRRKAFRNHVSFFFPFFLFLLSSHGKIPDGIYTSREARGYFLRKRKEGKPAPPPPPPISIDKLSRLFVTRREIEWRASHRRRRSSKVSQSLGGRIRVVGLASGEERGSSCGTVSPRGGEWVVGESNQPDRSSCFRSFARSFPLSPSHSLPLPPQPSYSFRGEHCRGATIDTWRGGGGGRGGGGRE